MIVFLFSYVMLIIVDFVPLINKKSYKQAIIFCALLVLSLYFSVSVALNKNIESPIVTFNRLLKKIGLSY